MQNEGERQKFEAEIADEIVSAWAEQCQAEHAAGTLKWWTKTTREEVLSGCSPHLAAIVWQKLVEARAEQPSQTRAAELESQLRNVLGEARGLMKVACRMIWAREHGLRIGRDDATDGSAYVMRLAHVLGLLPELNGAKFREFCEQLTGLSFDAAAVPVEDRPLSEWIERFEAAASDAHPRAAISTAMAEFQRFISVEDRPAPTPNTMSQTTKDFIQACKSQGITL